MGSSFEEARSRVPTEERYPPSQDEFQERWRPTGQILTIKIKVEHLGHVEIFSDRYTEYQMWPAPRSLSAEEAEL